MLSSLNLFDVLVTAAAAIAAVTGFKAGLVRSLAAILGYACAMPLAVTMASYLSPVANQAAMPWAQNSMLFFGLFLGAGLIIGALLRVAVNDLFGPSITATDRIAGSALGLVRVGLVAVAVVVVFDRIIPDDRQPAFLRDSHLRPLLSRAGRQGLNALSPDVAGYIDQLKREQKI